MSFCGPYLFELSFPRPTEQFEGSSFKPLSLLAHHPWVRASHHRSTVANPDGSMPRLSFLMQYYYLHGEYPPSSADHDDDERENTRTETETEENSGPQSNHNYHFESAEEGSATNDTASNASDDSSTASHLEVKSIGHTMTHPLQYVLRPSCNRSSSSSSSSSSTTSSSLTFRSRNARRQSFGTSPNMGLSAFHDVFATSICPSTDILFPVEILHRCPKKKRTKSKVLMFIYIGVELCI